MCLGGGGCAAAALLQLLHNVAEHQQPLRVGVCPRARSVSFPHLLLPDSACEFPLPLCVRHC